MHRAGRLAALVSDVQETEHKYLLHGPRYDPVHNPWMPYQPADFIGILWECLPEFKSSTRPWFLDVGCGPGTKMRIAQKLFGFDVYGVEIDPALAAEAGRHFPEGRVATGNAFSDDWSYSAYDLIWLYRPFRDSASEYRLEQKIIGQMSPGAILAGASWETDVTALGWLPVVDDCLMSPDGGSQIIRGAWQKPGLSPKA